MNYKVKKFYNVDPTSFKQWMEDGVPGPRPHAQQPVVTEL